MIWSLGVELYFGLYAEDKWEATIEIDSGTTLEELHHVIQEAVGFDDDHMYEFYIANSPTSRNKQRFDDENEGIYDVTLEDIYPLGSNNKLFYMFDYGDGWLFSPS